MKILVKSFAVCHCMTSQLLKHPAYTYIWKVMQPSLRLAFISLWLKWRFTSKCFSVAVGMKTLIKMK